MNKKTLVGIFAAAMMVFSASVVFAGEDAVVKAAGLYVYLGIAIACGFAIGIAALGCGLGMGNAINGALQGTARNPEAGGKIMTTMIIGLALIESLCIYALVICFILVFKIPDLGGMHELIVKSLGA
ncbi:MAG: ATP synthase F0 subunit C [Deltaproteobacteria bacterium]|nr:ATP synthase F0 subunit C [Deltaproteobacteria bacterium]